MKEVPKSVLKKAAKKMQEMEDDDPNAVIQVGSTCFLFVGFCLLLAMQAQTKVRAALREQRNLHQPDAGQQDGGSRGRGKGRGRGRGRGQSKQAEGEANSSGRGGKSEAKGSRVRKRPAARDDDQDKEDEPGEEEPKNAKAAKKAKAKPASKDEKKSTGKEVQDQIFSFRARPTSFMIS